MGLISKKLQNVRISETAKIKNLVDEKISKGQKILGLSVGEPNFKTPENIVLAAKKAITNGFTKYTQTSGIPELKNAIITKYVKEKNLYYGSDQIIVSSGGKQVIFNALFATLNPNDEVIIPSPFWVSYPDIVSLCGGNPVIVKTKFSNSYKITASDLEAAITPKTKWLILNSPTNPTGAVYSKNELRGISKILRKYPLIHVLSDDIYEHIIFEKEKCFNIVEVDEILKDRTLLINGVSKSHAMTGWRLGYGVGHPSIISAMNVVQSQSTSNASSISQYAAIEAILNSMEFVNKNKSIYEKRRDILLKILKNANGVRISRPMGAFYALPSIHSLIGKTTANDKIIKNDIDFASELFKSTSVAVVAGSSFGATDSFRISFAVEEETLNKACTLICNFVNSLK